MSFCLYKATTCKSVKEQINKNFSKKTANNIVIPEKVLNLQSLLIVKALSRKRKHRKVTRRAHLEKTQHR